MGRNCCCQNEAVCWGHIGTAKHMESPQEADRKELVPSSSSSLACWWSLKKRQLAEQELVIRAPTPVSLGRASRASLELSDSNSINLIETTHSHTSFLPRGLMKQTFRGCCSTVCMLKSPACDSSAQLSLRTTKAKHWAYRCSICWFSNLPVIGSLRMRKYCFSESNHGPPVHLGSWDWQKLETRYKLFKTLISLWIKQKWYSYLGFWLF